MFISHGVAETAEVGVHLAEQLRAGDVVAVVGDLGAGKTELVKGIARGLGSNDAVSSPTFTLVHEYFGGRLPLYHFDFYRLDGIDALRSIDFDEYVFGDGVTVIEWADKLRHAIPEKARWIKLSVISSDTRHIDMGPGESLISLEEDRGKGIRLK